MTRLIFPVRGREGENSVGLEGHIYTEQLTPRSVTVDTREAHPTHCAHCVPPGKGDIQEFLTPR